MVPEECDSCFTEMTEKFNKVVNIAQNSILKMNHDHAVSLEEREKLSTEFYQKQAELNKSTRDQLVSTVQWFLGIVLIFLLVSWGITGTTWLEVQSKADKSETVKRTEFELVIQQGDEYNRNVFVKKEDIKQDTTTYIANKNLIFSNVSRGSAYNKIIKNQQ